MTKYRTYKYCCALIQKEDGYLIDKLYAKFMVKSEILNRFGPYSRIKTKNSLLVKIDGIDLETFKILKSKLGFRHA